MLLRKLNELDLNNLFKLTSNEAVAKYMRFGKTQSIQETEKILEGYLMQHSFAIIIEEEFAGVFVLKDAKKKIIQ